MNSFFEGWSRHIGSGILARALLAVSYSAGYIYMTMQGIDPGDAYVAITTAVVLWFFKTGDEMTNQAQRQEQQTQMVELAKAIPVESTGILHKER
jgi:hypothetical protein